MRIRFSKCGIGIACALASHALIAAAAQDSSQQEIGVVYYADGSGFKALEKEPSPASGRSIISAKIKGSHAAVRFASGGAPSFRVCSIDPVRYKLYTLRSTKASRDVAIAKVNLLVGGTKSVLLESEVPVTIKATDGGCFAITPKGPLPDGEYAFSPIGDEFAFTFGIGTAKPVK